MKKVAVLILLCLCSYSRVFALTKVDITGAQIQPLPIAIAPFLGDKNIASELRDIIVSDLEGTGLFRVIEEDTYIDSVNIAEHITFASWRQIRATNLVGGALDRSNSVMKFKMWDVFSQVETLSGEVLVSGENIRRSAHKIADEIYKKLTGEDGYFNSKVTYVSLIKDTRGRYKRRIAVMDYDGYNHEFLMSLTNNIVLTPRFSPDAKKILYLSYESKGDPRVREIEVATKSTRSFGEFKGMSYAPRYVDDNNALVAVTKDGSSNLYLLNLDNMEKKQLTYCTSICTSPSVSPTKSKIVYNSDMGGTKQLYVMDYSGKSSERITFGDGQYSSPVWSPRGDLIAFTKTVPGKGFFIGVIRPDGSGEKLITRGWLVDGAAWSSNGRVLMFEKEISADSGVGIYTIDITGHNEKRVKTPYDASDPYWSKNF